MKNKPRDIRVLLKNIETEPYKIGKQENYVIPNRAKAYAHLESPDGDGVYALAP